MQNKETIDVLNKLITINNDRIEGYQTASKETEEQELKTLFEQFIDTSKTCKNELEEEVMNLGGEPSEGTKTSGKFFRVWMDVKAALTGKDREGILNSCEYGEDQAQEAYDEVLEDDLEYLNTNQQTLINSQKSILKEDHNHVKSLRDALVHS